MTSAKTLKGCIPKKIFDDFDLFSKGKNRKLDL
jgi:hypothetical protein